MLRLSDGTQEYLVWHWFEVAEEKTTSRLRAKLAEARARLTGQSTHGAFVAVVTAIEDGEEPAAATLASFLSTVSDVVSSGGASESVSSRM